MTVEGEDGQYGIVGEMVGKSNQRGNSYDEM